MNNLSDSIEKGIPSRISKINTFMHIQKICELDHVKTTFICPSCFGRVSFNVKSETTFSISSDIDAFDMSRLRTTFFPSCNKCNRVMFECDEDFVDRIIKLNHLGIITLYCCSGHNETIDRICDNKLIGIEDYSFPYIIINTLDTKPEVVSKILSKALIKRNNLTVTFMDDGLRISPKTPNGIDLNDTVLEADQKWLKETLFKFIDNIISYFDTED